MTRAPSLLLALLLAVTGLGIVGVVSAAPSQAAGTMTGRLVDPTTGKGAAGVRVRLLGVVRDGAGSVKAAATTGPDGRFSITAPDDSSYLQVLESPRYQGGWVDAEAPFHVVRPERLAGVFHPRALGTIGIDPAYVSGKVVDSVTGKPVKGVKVRAGVYGGPVQGRDVTDARGRFEVRGVTCKGADCFLRLRGARVGYLDGARDCSGEVVPPGEEECGISSGAIGKVRIDPVGPEPAMRRAGLLTGRIVAVGTGAGVGGMTMRLRLLGSEGGPGAVVDTATTAADGTFALDAGPDPEDEYYVQGAPGAYQGGYVGGSPTFLQPDAADAATWSADAALGKIRANPAFIKGVLVDAATRRPVRGVRVYAGTQHQAPVDSVITDAKGRFRLQGITCEDECYLRFRGRPRYENGYRGCAGGVVATWGAACASPLGAIGKVRIDQL